MYIPHKLVWLGCCYNVVTYIYDVDGDSIPCEWNVNIALLQPLHESFVTSYAVAIYIEPHCVTVYLSVCDQITVPKAPWGRMYDTSYKHNYI